MVRREQTRARVQIDRDVYTDYIYDIFYIFGKDVAYRKKRRRLIVIVNVTSARPPEKETHVPLRSAPVAHLINIISNVPYFVYI